jgi:hypothetical protein
MDDAFATELKSIDWLSRCGSKSAQSLACNLPVVYAADRVEAESLCLSQEWEDETLEASNRLTEFLDQNDRASYQRWNAIVEDAKKCAVAPLGSSIWTPRIRALGFNQDLIHSLNWDITGAAVEHAYSFVPGRPTFFLDLLGIYKSGWLPCGWRGSWPEGSLVIW